MIFIFSSLLTLLSMNHLHSLQFPGASFITREDRKSQGTKELNLKHFCLETVLNTAFLDHCEEILTTHAQLSARAKVPGLVFTNRSGTVEENLAGKLVIKSLYQGGEDIVSSFSVHFQ